ncbi:MAG TPA: hypothetical protein VHE35_11255, partial [Kofleriaceae bacterium]|nr:hypothetical protein [Kofleriaceae bacterium]
PGTGVVVAVLLADFVPVMFAAPYRMFWRRDAHILARLPIPGAALWWVALVRAARAALLGAIVVAPTLVALAWIDPASGARGAALAGALVVATIALLPGICLAAAWLVATGRMEQLASSMAGDYRVENTTVMGALPGATIAGVVVGVLYAAPWIVGGRGAAGPIATGVIVGAALVAGAAATAAARTVYPLAMREVAALDRQAYAHLEIHGATFLERLVRGRLGAGAAPVFDRIARLVRRRYPLVVFAGVVLAATLLVVGGVRPAEPLPWLVGCGAAAGLLARWLGRAVARAPIELPRSTAMLPVAPHDVRRARTAYVGLWTSLFVIVPAAIAATLLRWPAVPMLAFAGAALLGVLVASGAGGGGGASWSDDDGA